MMETERRERLQFAAEHIFSMGIDDAASSLCIANMQFGLAKIHYAQEQLGLSHRAVFIGTPDMTITRNTGRWKSGFGYGGKIVWGDADTEFVVLDVKPNTCGMLVGGLDARPDLAALTHRLHALNDAKLELDGIPLTWDLAEGNHFVDVFEVSTQEPGLDLQPFAFVVHAAGAELRKASAHGPGLYWDASNGKRESAANGVPAGPEAISTPWGVLNVMTGGRARAYLEFYNRAEDFAARRRALAATELFGEYTEIANVNHQGLRGMNQILLGCQDSVAPHLCPVMLRADLPAYLMRGLPNVTDARIDAFGWRERAARLGVLDIILQANIIPHGAGYLVPSVGRVQAVREVGEQRYFELSSQDGGGVTIISEPKNITQQYRGLEVVERTLACELGTVAAKLTPLFVLKT
jgi:hypothetical protein